MPIFELLKKSIYFEDENDKTKCNKITKFPKLSIRNHFTTTL